MESREGGCEGQEPNPANAALNKNETDKDWKIAGATGTVILDKQEIF